MRFFLISIFLFLAAAPAHAVRVLIVEKSSKLEIETTNQILISTKNKKYLVSKGGSFQVLSLPGEKIKVGNLEFKEPVKITPLEGAVFTINKSKYSGDLNIYPGKNVFEIVEDVDLEEYLYGVLPYEMAYSWPIEALKAQAVAARTYTLKTLSSPVGKTFDLYSDIRSQMYKGAATVYPSVQEAVDFTKNKVLKWKNEPFYTYYHANCGGVGTDPLPWGAAGSNIRPLNGAKCGYDLDSKNHTWSLALSKSTIDKFVNAQVKSISVTKRAQHGHATELTFRTNKGNIRKSCHDFRMTMGSTKIKSCYIDKITLSGANFNFSGFGYGHGTGLCQEGARGMANKGKNFLEILNNYYPGAELTDI